MEPYATTLNAKARMVCAPEMIGHVDPRQARTVGFLPQFDVWAMIKPLPNQANTASCIVQLGNCKTVRYEQAWIF